MLNLTITIDKEFIKFVKVCFGKANFETQHDQYDIGEYSLTEVDNAYHKYTSPVWVFDYNCSDCSFPKFKKISTGETEGCPLCGD